MLPLKSEAATRHRHVGLPGRAASATTARTRSACGPAAPTSLPSCSAVLPAPERPRKLAEPRLPAQRRPAEEPVVRDSLHRTLPPLRIDAQIAVQTLLIEHCKAVAHPVVPSGASRSRTTRSRSAALAPAPGPGRPRRAPPGKGRTPRRGWGTGRVAPAENVKSPSLPPPACLGTLNIRLSHHAVCPFVRVLVLPPRPGSQHRAA